MASDAESFTDKADDLLWFQMVKKKGAAYGVKTVVAKGKGQSVATHARIGCAKMRWNAVQNDRAKRNARPGQYTLCMRCHVTFTACDVHPGEFLQAAFLCDAAQQTSHGANTAKCAVEHPKVLDGGLYFMGSAVVGI